MNKKLMITLSALLFLSCAICEAKIIDLKETVFPNGLTLVTSEDNSAPVVTFQLFVDASKRREEKGITGISHIAEHYFFLGSGKVPPGDFSKIVTKWGGSDNAYTGMNYTTYYASVPKEKLDNVAELLADMLSNKTFPEEQFKNEIKVIQEERRLTDNSPERSAFLNFMELIYQGTKYAYPTLGYWDDLKTIKLEDVRNYYRNYYSPANVICVVAGNVTHEEASSVFGKWFAGLGGKKPLPAKKQIFKTQSEERRQISQREGQMTPLLYIGYPAVAYDDPDHFPLEVLESVLSEGESSRLITSILKEKKLATSVSAYLLDTKESSAFVIQAEPLEGISVSSLERNIYAEIEKIKAQGPGPEELARVINNARKDFIANIQSTRSKSELIGVVYMLSDRKGKYLDDYLDRLEKVTAQDVAGVARKYLTRSKRNVYVQLPKGGSYYGTKLDDVKIKDYMHAKEVIFQSGLKLYYSYSGEVPSVNMQITVSAGSSQDRNGLEGTAGLLATLLTKGTKKRSEDDISKELDDNAIELYADASVEDISILSSFLKESSDLAIDISADIMTNMEIKGDILEREKERVASYIESRKAIPGYAGAAALARVLYPDSGLGHPETGTIIGVRKVSARDLTDFYKKYFNSANTVITVVGDIELEYLVDLIGEKFNGYPVGGAKTDLKPVEPRINGVKYYIVDMPWLTQSYIYIGGRGLTRTNTDYNKARVMNFILGGSGFSSRLMDNLRAKIGLAYSVSSGLVSYRQSGFFRFAIQTKTESTRTAIAGFFKEIEAFLDKGATQAEFDDAKSFYSGNLPFKVETTGQKAAAVSDGVFYGFGPEMAFRDVEEIKKLAIDEVNGQSQLFSQKDFTVVIAGKKDDLEQQLTGLGPLEIIKLELLY
jgi:zinc protease